MREKAPAGKRFGRLVIKGNAPTKKRYPSQWYWICDCGKEGSSQGYSIIRGMVVSCGCKRREGQKPVPGSKNRHPLYGVWCSMKERCSNPNVKSFPCYGGRGIKVCERWKKDFWNFVNDMPGWEKGLSIERVDVNGNYEPENCRWATQKEQSNNSRSNRRFEVNGSVKTVSQLSEEYGVPYHRLYNRLVLKGWPIGKALRLPYHARHKYND